MAIKASLFRAGITVLGCTASPFAALCYIHWDSAVPITLAFHIHGFSQLQRRPQLAKPFLLTIPTTCSVALTYQVVLLLFVFFVWISRLLGCRSLKFRSVSHARGAEASSCTQLKFWREAFNILPYIGWRAVLQTMFKSSSAIIRYIVTATQSSLWPQIDPNSAQKGARAATHPWTPLRDQGSRERAAWGIPDLLRV